MPLLKERIDLCWKMLPDVSRSFALCIKKLPKPTDVRMMISYLLLRIIDTIEDSNATLATKEKAFSSILKIFKTDTPTPGGIAECRDTLLSEIEHTYEHGLLKNLEAVLDVFGSFKNTEKTAIIDCAENMSRGMMKFQDQPITNFTLQEEYCHYVAGLVGYLDTHLFYLGGHISERLRDELMESARYFGVALQKVNILRDVAYDIPKGRHFWPSRLLEQHGLEYKNLCEESNRPEAMKVLREMVENALPYLDAAVNYVTRLPRMERKIRIFCLIPLFMALKSYSESVGNENIFVIGQKIKINKDDVRLIARNSFLLASSNWAIRRWYRSSISAVKDRLGATDTKLAHV